MCMRVCIDACMHVCMSLCYKMVGTAECAWNKSTIATSINDGNCVGAYKFKEVEAIGSLGIHRYWRINLDATLQI